MGEKKIIIDPRVIQHLGRDLITSPDVAIIELIKNSMDAKSKTVNVHLFESFSKVFDANNFLIQLPPEIEGFVPGFLKSSSVLVVEDEGCGMSTTQLESGFLKIGTSIKSDKSGNGILLGEKGIGRLAAQRLGSVLIVETASDGEGFASLTYLDWNLIIKGEQIVPYERINYFPKSYTRLWIFNVNLEDILEYPSQLSFDLENEISLNRELQSAMNFLISPFKSDTASPIINVFFNDKIIDTQFPREMLTLSESTHYFKLNKINDNIVLNYGLNLKPWYIERVHRALVKAEGFARLKKPHQYYKQLLEENSQRIEQALVYTLEKDELFERLFDFNEELYPKMFNRQIKDKYKEVFIKRTHDSIDRLCEITPIVGEIYSFKQNAAIGENIIIDSVRELEGSKKDLNLKDLKLFLDDYNGIKLYRGDYRIGFLGNKESDWIKLQQTRTKGQQWFRFDLGNTVGYVSLHDPHQERIKEISSRLDISQNNVSEAFKLFINIIFNKLFYELNQKANAIIKNILDENNLLGDSLSKRVKKNSNLVQRMIKKNKEMMDNIQEVSRVLEKQVVVDDALASMPRETYDSISKVISDIKEHFKEDQEAHTEAAQLLAEADKQLKIIEVESYNNYKLMANGLITETITHELHSLSTTNTGNQVDQHFEFLKKYFNENKEVKVYNNHVHPIRNGYNVISKKMQQVGDMYSFLEKTFIKKGTYDEFVPQNVSEIVEDVYSNLIKTSRIKLKCNIDGLTWFVPKGVLIHVFYNLFSNSNYWIDIRRKRAEKDQTYILEGEDQIVIEKVADDTLLVWDTGTGVASNMQDILFEPLQSGKPFSEGRGMGLYIVKKLMNSFGGDIILLPDKNKFSNRFKFLLTIDKSEGM
jgi:signal transduction histidine kinase